MDYPRFMGFVKEMSRSINGNSRAVNTLTNIFFDYIKKLNISTEDIKSIYPQNFFNNNLAAIIAVLQDDIIIVRYICNTNEGFTNTAYVRIIRKACIKEIELISKSDSYFKEIDVCSKIQVDIKLDNKEIITLSNYDDSNEQWKSDYSEMILELISQL